MSIAKRKQRVRGGKRARRWRESEAAVAVREWAKSGVSAEKFAEARGYSGERLRRWGHRLQGAASPSSPRVEFAPVEVAASALTVTPQQIVIEVGRVTVRIREDLDTERLALIVGALARTTRAC